MMHLRVTWYLAIALCAAILGCAQNNNPAAAPGEPYTIIGGHVRSPLTSFASPYMVTSTLIVDSSATLSVQAGVQIYFEDSTEIIVHGALSCLGSSSSPILFAPKNASWKGIQITGTSAPSLLKFVIVQGIDVTVPTDTSRNGAVEITNANVVIHNSIFRNNTSSNGGAVMIDQSQSVITNNLFINNYAAVLGGAFISSSSTNTIVNNTFYGNRSANFAGGLLLMSPVFDIVQNNIFYSNTSATGDPRIALLGTDSTHCVIQYNFLEGGGINPDFTSSTDFHLLPSSPCITAGNPDTQYNNADGTRNDQGAYGGPLGKW